MSVTNRNRRFRVRGWGFRIRAREFGRAIAVAPMIVVAASLDAESSKLGAGSPASRQSASTRPRITGISHVAFRVSDASAARQFYGGVLGFEEQHASKGAQIVFGIGTHQRLVLEPGLRIDQEDRLSHLAFETPDVSALAAYLRARGVRVEQPSERCEEGAVRVTDPDDHVIEFVQGIWPPGPPRTAGRALSARLLHAGLTIRDEETAHKFYRDVLGFGEIWRGGRTQITQWVNMRVPDGTDYLEYMLVSSVPDRRQLGVLHHVCLLVPEIQAAWEEVARRTSGSARALIAPPNVGVNGRWQLNLYDADGTRSELMEPYRVR
jgi:catechol 2,3-dioxygenase-like lactoylglutathione lyase family enzyme